MSAGQKLRLLISMSCLLMSLLSSQVVAKCVNPLERMSSVTVSLNDSKLTIPRDYSTEPPYQSWFKWIPGLDSDSKSTLILIPDEDIACAVPGYRFEHGSKFKEDVLLLVQVMSKSERRGYTDPEFAMISSIRLGIGLFAGREVKEEDAIPGVFRYYKDERKEGWILLRLAPNKTLPVGHAYFDYLVSDCQKFGPSHRRIASCTSIQFVDNYSVEFAISEYNLPSLQQIKKLVAQLVRKWGQSQ